MSNPHNHNEAVALEPALGLNKPLKEYTTTDLPEIAGLIRREHKLAGASALTAIEHAVGAGRLLVRARELQEHGQWLPWLKENFDGSVRTAQQYVKLAENWTLLPAKLKAQSSAHLTIDKALAALAKPSRKSLHEALTSHGQPQGGKARAIRRDDSAVDEALQDVRYVVRNVVNRLPDEHRAEAVEELRELADETDLRTKKKPEYTLPELLDRLNDVVRAVLARCPQEFIETAGHKLVRMGTDILETGGLRE